MKEITIPPDRVFIGIEHLQNAGDGRLGESYLRYHIWLIMKDMLLYDRITLLIAIALKKQQGVEAILQKPILA